MSDYKQFNKIQQAFYTSVFDFNNFSNYEITANSYLLLNNIVKGQPTLANTVFNIYSPDCKALQSPELLKALQRKFHNGFSKARIPQFIYFKDQSKADKKKKQQDKIDDKIKQQICSMLFIDSKDFEYLKNTPKIKDLYNKILKLEKQ